MRERFSLQARGAAPVWRLAAVATLLLTLLTGALATPGVTLAAPTTLTFAHTGAAQTWTVPAGVTSATFDVYGAQGGSSPYMTGGLGGRAQITLSVTPGTTYQIMVGGRGASRNSADSEVGGPGGFNGGGAGGQGFISGSGGGGASDVRTGGFALADRLIVAGGGGGTAWGFAAGGGGGGSSGANGPCDTFDGSVCGGGGGTQVAGGAGGAGAAGEGALPGADGTLGVGGVGGAHTMDGGGGGGGGGGYYGGGGGGARYSGRSGGGGGSGFGPAGVAFETGVRVGDGQVLVTFTLPDAPTSVAPSGSATYGAATATLTAIVTVTSGGGPVPAGGVVTFTFNGLTYQGTTNNLGVAMATAPLPPGTGVGTYAGAVQASYAGADGFTASGPTSGPLVVASAPSQLTQVRGSATYGESTATLTATLSTTSGAPVSGATVTFTLQGVAVCGVDGKPACPVTNALGVAQLPGVAIPAGLNAGTYANRVCATYAGYAGYLSTGPICGPLIVARRIVWVKPTDRTVGLRQPTPPTTPPANCLASATTTSACWLQLTNDSSFVNGDDWADLNLAQLRFAYSRTGNGPTNERVGATYRITALGALSANYDLRYQTGTLRVVAP